LWDTTEKNDTTQNDIFLLKVPLTAFRWKFRQNQLLEHSNQSSEKIKFGGDNQNTTKQEKITKILSNGNVESNTYLAAEELNSFFSKIGKDISNSIQSTEKEPISYINVPENAPFLSFKPTDPTCCNWQPWRSSFLTVETVTGESCYVW
jgi:hypothetical protein